MFWAMIYLCFNLSFSRYYLYNLWGSLPHLKYEDCWNNEMSYCEIRYVNSPVLDYTRFLSQVLLKFICILLFFSSFFQLGLSWIYYYYLREMNFFSSSNVSIYKETIYLFACTFYLIMSLYTAELEIRFSTCCKELYERPVLCQTCEPFLK